MFIQPNHPIDVSDNGAGDFVFNMLGFQYKPLEAQLLRSLEAAGRLEDIRNYKKLPTVKKIAALDRFAGFLGL